jgi:hypothetical protein
MIRVDGGYLILNYMRYRDFDHSAAERQRRLRERRRETVTRDSHSVTRDSNGASRIADADADAESMKNKNAASPLPVGLNTKAWTEWLAYRTERKLSKYRPSSITKSTTFLAAHDQDEQQRIVDASIRNGYQGLFEPKSNGSGKTHKGRRLTRYEELYGVDDREVETEAKP